VDGQKLADAIDALVDYFVVTLDEVLIQTRVARKVVHELFDAMLGGKSIDKLYAEVKGE
jgi:hypothetical protein